MHITGMYESNRPRISSPDGDCGNITLVNAEDLLSGKTGSCGCRRTDALTRRITHGLSRVGHRSLAYTLFLGAKNRAKKIGVPFDITFEDVVIPERCPVLGISLIHNAGGRSHKPNSPSIDRLIPGLGYTKNNIWVISMRANAIKSNCSVEELQRLVDTIKAKIRQLNPSVGDKCA
jgi:hypothetical protein